MANADRKQPFADKEHPLARSGLAATIRAWMRNRVTPFTMPQVCDGIGAEGRDRDRVRNSIRDFVLRGEVTRKTREGQGLLAWNPRWRSSPLRSAPLREKIVKAMYVAHIAFTAKDIQRLSESDINYVQKMLHTYQRLGHIQAMGKHGRWTLYKLTNSERFRLEVMP